MKNVLGYGGTLVVALLMAAGTLTTVSMAKQPATDPTPPARKRPAPEQPPPADPTTDPTTDPAPATDPANPAPTPATPAPTTPAPVKPTTKAPATKTPAAPAKAAPVAPAAPALKVVNKQLVEPGPYVTRSDSRDWTLKATVKVSALSWDEVVHDPQSGKQTTMPKHDEFDFENLWVVFPLIPQTAISVPIDQGWTGKLRIDNKVLTEDVTLMPNLTAGTRLGKLTAKNGHGRAVDFEYTVKMMSYKTKLDEAKAAKVGWPLGDWPAVPKSTFQEQMFLDTFPDGYTASSAPMDKDALKNMVNGWLKTAGIKDPHDVTPLHLAKFLTGRVSESFQRDGDGLGMQKNGLLQGVALQPIPVTIKRGRGSEFDIVNLLVAVFRQVGLPARVVVGQEGGGEDNGFLDPNNHGTLRAWAEFCLYDENFEEKKASINWIPVDVIALRKTSSRVPPLEKTWHGFGSIDDGNILCPFAFQFHPPTTVRSYGSPGFWGWFMAPHQPSEASQALSFEVNRSAVSSPNKTDSNVDQNGQPVTTTPPKTTQPTKTTTPKKKKP